MSNQSLLPYEKQYPERLVIDDTVTSWDVEAPDYNPPINPEFWMIQQKLEEKGVVLVDEKELNRLATLNNQQATESYGEAILAVRHPLGRTGINGVLGYTFEYATAGESGAADMAIVRTGDQDREILLVRNRNKWSLPGGFCDNDEERADRRIAALREAYEETSLDLTQLAQQGLVRTVEELHVKPNSRRSTDMGYLTNQVEGVMLPDSEMGDEAEPGDDAEAVAWITYHDLYGLQESKQISKDHFNYAVKALTVLE